MRKVVEKWLLRQLENPDLFRDRNVVRFSLRLTLRAIMVADSMVILVHLILENLQLLPYPLTEALIIGLSVSTVTSAAVTYMFAFYMGIALRAVSISRDEFQKLSATDMLTGLLNRRSFFQQLEDAGSATIFVIFDIDRFKQINDTFGHDAGDAVIREVGKTLADVFGQASRAVARLGGEEFAVLLDAQMSARSFELVDHARQRVSDLVVQVENGGLKVTISAGIAETGDGLDAFGVYKAADRALYFAKAAGRNRIVHARDIPRIHSDTENPGLVPTIAA